MLTRGARVFGVKHHIRNWSAASEESHSGLENKNMTRHIEQLLAQRDDCQNLGFTGPAARHERDLLHHCNLTCKSLEHIATAAQNHLRLQPSTVKNAWTVCGMSQQAESALETQSGAGSFWSAVFSKKKIGLSPRGAGRSYRRARAIRAACGRHSSRRFGHAENTEMAVAEIVR